MQIVAVAPAPQALKNAGVDKEAFGAEIARLRRVKFGTQKALADAAGVSANTLRGLEKGKLDTRGPQLAKVLAALGVTFEDVTRGDAVEATDPLIAGLNREDLEIARRYHDAPTAVRQRAHALLRDGEQDFSVRLAVLSPELANPIKTMIDIQIADALADDSARVAAPTRTDLRERQAIFKK